MTATVDGSRQFPPLVCGGDVAMQEAGSFITKSGNGSRDSSEICV